MPRGAHRDMAWPAAFRPKDDASLMNTTRTVLGMNAQDVKAAMDAVEETVFHGWSEASNGQQMMGESAFVYPLINAIKELAAKVATLEART